MAIISQTRVWNGVTTRIDTNTETGATYIYRPSRGIGLSDKLLFTSEGKSGDWIVRDAQLVANLYNSKNGTDSTSQEVADAFISQGHRVYDNDRAAVLNNPDNYSSPEEAKIRQKAFFDNNLPGIINPDTNVSVNTNSTVPTVPTGPIPLEVIDFDENNPPPIETGTGEDETPATVNQNFGCLQYPLNDPFGLDYIKIDIVGYVPSLSLGGSFLGSGSQSATRRYQDKSTKGTILLPMQPALSETSSIDWGDDKLNAFQAIAARAVGGAMEAFGTFSPGDLTALKEKLRGELKSLGADANKILTDGQLEGFVKSYFAGKIVGANVFGRSTGSVINPNLELLFNGPRLRQFNFNFKLTPRQPAEASVIREIIFRLKKHSAPKKSSGQLFLKFPDIFKLEYVYQGSGQHPFMNKFKPCALTNVSVDYTPDGSYMTYGENGSMTSYNLALSFGEIEPNYEDEYQNPSDMGF